MCQHRENSYLRYYWVSPILQRYILFRTTMRSRALFLKSNNTRKCNAYITKYYIGWLTKSE